MFTRSVLMSVLVCVCWRVCVDCWCVCVGAYVLVRMCLCVPETLCTTTHAL